MGMEMHGGIRERDGGRVHIVSSSAVAAQFCSNLLKEIDSTAKDYDNDYDNVKTVRCS